MCWYMGNTSVCHAQWLGSAGVRLVLHPQLTNGQAGHVNARI